MTRFGHALFGILPAWRCRACDLRARCRGLIARGFAMPAAACPNVRLFADRP